MCDKCKAIKEFLSSANIEFKEVDLGDDEGVVELRKIYPKLKDKVERTEDGQLPIPLIVSMENEEVKATAHTLDEVKELIK
jgi:glutaredoxin